MRHGGSANGRDSRGVLEVGQKRLEVLDKSFIYHYHFLKTFFRKKEGGLGLMLEEVVL